MEEAEEDFAKAGGTLGFSVLLVAVLALAAAGCGGDDDDGGDGGGGGGGAVGRLPSASCGPIRKGEEEPDALIASDFPLQGANRSLTTEMADAIEFMLEQQDWKAGDTMIGYQSCDDSTAQAGSWDSAKCSSNARAYANNASVIGVIGTFNSGCAKLVIPIANRADGPSRWSARRTRIRASRRAAPARRPASRTTTTRPASGTTRASSGTTSSRAPRTRSTRRSSA